MMTRHLRPFLGASLLIVLLATPFVFSDDDKKKSGDKSDGFGEKLSGAVPDGAAEMVTPDTDKAIESGLKWLASSQKPDGSFGSGGSYSGNVAITGLAGLAFLSSGSTPGRGPYGANVEKAVEYIVNNTSESGLIAPPGNSQPMYGHGFATLFLAEVYGMTQNRQVRDKLEKAVRLIVDTQNAEGGWRYQPVRRDADLSITICQMNALRAARNAGIFVPKETVDSCLKYVNKSQKPDGSFRYTLQADQSGFPMTAAGLVALFSVGKYDGPEVQKGMKFLGDYEISSPRSPYHYFYGLYYLSQVMWTRGGDDWGKWYPLIRNDLLKKMQGNHWNDTSICPEYGTAMALIILQVPNSYLPIFQR